MCTLFASVRQFPGCPLIVAANRDEQLDRPASGPRIWKLKVPFLAPRDDGAGGTWLGLNREGLFVAVTNRFGAARDRTRASRGALVVDALQASSAAVVHQRLGTMDAARYNPFHLFYADAQDAFVTWYDGAQLQQLKLEPGLHVITERSFAPEEAARVRTVTGRWRFDAAPSPEALAALLRVHRDDDPLASTCIHAPAFNYGTRSSLVLHRATDLARSQIHWADGPPCQSDFAPQPRWIAALVAA